MKYFLCSYNFSILYEYLIILNNKLMSILNMVPVILLANSRPGRQTVQQYNFVTQTMNYCVTNADVTEYNISFRVVLANASQLTNPIYKQTRSYDNYQLQQ